MVKRCNVEKIVREGYKMEDIREEMNIVFIPSSDKRMLVLSMLVMYYTIQVK